MSVCKRRQRHISDRGRKRNRVYGSIFFKGMYRCYRVDTTVCFGADGRTGRCFDRVILYSVGRQASISSKVCDPMRSHQPIKFHDPDELEINIMINSCHITTVSEYQIESDVNDLNPRIRGEKSKKNRWKRCYAYGDTELQYRKDGGPEAQKRSIEPRVLSITLIPPICGYG